MVDTYDIKNREHWLTLGADMVFYDVTSPAGYSTNVNGDPLISALRISVGHPSKFAFRKGGKALGETFDANFSTDGTTEIFITPFLDDSIEVLTQVVHEMGHAVLGVKQGHNENYAIYMAKVGLKGTVTKPVITPKLRRALEVIVSKLGPYPHSKLDASKMPATQSTRMLKCICINKTCPHLDLHNGKPYSGRFTWMMVQLPSGTPMCGACKERMAIIKPSGKKQQGGGGGGAGGGGGEQEKPEDELIVIDPDQQQSGGGEGEGDGDEGNESSDSGESSGDGDGADSDGEAGSSAEGEAGEGGSSEDKQEEPLTPDDGSGSDNADEQSGTESTRGDSSVDAGSGEGEGDSTDDGTVGEGEGEEASGGEAEGEDTGEAEGSAIRLRFAVVEAEPEDRKAQGGQNHQDQGGDGSGKLQRGRTNVLKAHPVDMTCKCGTCVAQRKLMGL
jgi:hypothetical protein